jgi:RNA polymerase sigma-70 factor, ECF subfamily
MAVGSGFDEVLTAAQAGADWAIGRLFQAHDPELRRYLEGRAAGQGEDLAQEVWIAAARNLRSFRGGESAFRSWLFSIARTKLIDHVRRAGRRPSTATDPQVLDAAPPTFEPTDELAARDAVLELTAGLPDEQADIVLLRVVGGFSVDEVAAIVGKRPGAVRVAQHRALRRLAGRLVDEAVTP